MLRGKSFAHTAKACLGFNEHDLMTICGNDAGEVLGSR